MLVIFKRQLKALYVLLNQLINAQVDKAGDSVEALYRAKDASSLDNTYLISDCQKKLEAIGLSYDKSIEELMETVQTRKKLGMSLLRQIQILEGALEKSKVFRQNLMGIMETFIRLLERDPYYANACRDKHPLTAQTIAMLDEFFARYRATQIVCLYDVDQTLIIENMGQCSFNDNVMTVCRDLDLTEGVFLSQYDADALSFTPEHRAQRGYITRLELLDYINSKVGGFNVWGIVGTLDCAYGKKENAPLGALYDRHYRKVDQLIKEGKSAQEFEGELKELDACLLEFATESKLFPKKLFISDGRVPAKAVNYTWIRQHLPEPDRVFLFIDDKQEFRDMLCQQHRALGFDDHCMMTIDPLVAKTSTPKSIKEYRDEFQTKIYDLLCIYNKTQQDRFLIAHLLRHKGNCLIQFSDVRAVLHGMLLDAVERMAKDQSAELVDMLVLINAHKVLGNTELRLIYQTVITRAMSVLSEPMHRFELVFPIFVELLKSMQSQCPKQVTVHGATKKRNSFVEKKGVASHSKFIESMNDFYKAIEPFYAPGQIELGADQCLANLEGLHEVITKLQQILAVYKLRYQPEKTQHSACPIICYLSDYFASLLVEIQYRPNKIPHSNSMQSGMASMH